jgi:hypothetical protein
VKSLTVTEIIHPVTFRLRGDYTCGKNLAVLVQCCKVLPHAVAVTVM